MVSSLYNINIGVCYLKNKLIFTSVFLSLALVGCSDEGSQKEEILTSANKEKSSVVIDESSEDNVNEKVSVTEDDHFGDGKESDLLKGLYEGEVGGYVKVKEFLQSIKQEKIGFVVAYPFAFKTDYSFELSDEEIEKLQITDEKDVITYTVVTLQNSLEESTMNLLAPIVVNVKNKKGKQVVLLDNEKYPLKYALGNLEGSAK